MRNRIGMALTLVQGLVVFTFSFPSWGDELPSPPAPINGGTFQVGEAHQDITPSAAQASRVYLGGYGMSFTRGPMKSVHDPIFARAISIRPSEQEQTVIFVVLDSVGLSNRLTQEIHAGFRARFPRFKGQLFVSATHSHSAPDLMGLWGWVPRAYLEIVKAKTIQAMSDAYLNGQEARLLVGNNTALAENRRGWIHTDSEMTVLQAVSTAAPYSVIATLVNFAAHPTVLEESNHALSRDFCGYLVDELEKIYRAPALFINADEGDALPLRNGQKADFNVARHYGEYLAERVVGALQNKIQLSSTISVSEKSWIHTVNSSLIKLAVFFKMLDFVFFRSAKSGLEVEFPVSYIKIGELQMAAYPGEAVTRLGMGIRERMSSRYRMMLGLTNGSLGYLLGEDEWDTGRNYNYEENLSIDMHIGERMKQEFITLMK